MKTALVWVFFPSCLVRCLFAAFTQGDFVSTTSSELVQSLENLLANLGHLQKLPVHPVEAEAPGVPHVGRGSLPEISSYSKSAQPYGPSNLPPPFSSNELASGVTCGLKSVGSVAQDAALSPSAHHTQRYDNRLTVPPDENYWVKTFSQPKTVVQSSQFSGSTLEVTFNEAKGREHSQLHQMDALVLRHFLKYEILVYDKALLLLMLQQVDEINDPRERDLRRCLIRKLAQDTPSDQNGTVFMTINRLFSGLSSATEPSWLKNSEVDDAPNPDKRRNDYATRSSAMSSLPNNVAQRLILAGFSKSPVLSPALEGSLAGVNQGRHIIKAKSAIEVKRTWFLAYTMMFNTLIVDSHTHDPEHVKILQTNAIIFFDTLWAKRVGLMIESHYYGAEISKSASEAMHQLMSCSAGPFKVNARIWRLLIEWLGNCRKNVHSQLDIICHHDPSYRRVKIYFNTLMRMTSDLIARN